LENKNSSFFCKKFLKILWNKKVVGSPEGIPQQVNHRNFGKVHLGPQQNLGNKNSRFFLLNLFKYSDYSTSALQYYFVKSVNFFLTRCYTISSKKIFLPSVLFS
ncbi:MAG: hypothetical protein EDM72_11270, partial [Chlorobiota bacterium]